MQRWPSVDEREFKFISDPVAQVGVPRRHDYIYAATTSVMQSLECDMANNAHLFRLPGIDDNVIALEHDEGQPMEAGCPRPSSA